MLTRTALVALLPAVVRALAEVTATSLGSGCEAYPGYDASTGVAGPWTIQLSGAENTAIDGFSDVSRYSIAINNGKPTIRWGSVGFPPLIFAWFILRRPRREDR